MTFIIDHSAEWAELIAASDAEDTAAAEADAIAEATLSRPRRTKHFALHAV